jgi:glutathione S-transferase
MSNESSEQRTQNDGKTVTLYGPPEIPFTEKVRRALLYKRISFDVIEPSSPEDYRRWNPATGLLPVLEVDGEIYPDSTEILFKLDEIFPDPPLLSMDARVSGQQKQLEEWADENLLWYFNKWRRSQEEADQRRDESNATLVRRFPGLRTFLAWLRAGGTWERPEIAILRGVGDRLDDLLGFLGTRSFFYSDTVSMADLGVYSMLYSLGLGVIPGSQRLVTDRAVLVDFMRRVEAETGEPAGSP